MCVCLCDSVGVCGCVLMAVNEDVHHMHCARVRFHMQLAGSLMSASLYHSIILILYIIYIYSIIHSIILTRLPMVEGGVMIISPCVSRRMR